MLKLAMSRYDEDFRYVLDGLHRQGFIVTHMSHRRDDDRTGTREARANDTSVTREPTMTHALCSAVNSRKECACGAKE